jgi:prepilin-type N-terminal cleavage/methylation domain-containing protein/prepilin-type processing-associated H-X9-DG protein
MREIMRKIKGFTLIELLVVISIIALLMGILMPTLAKAKKKAQAVACQGLLKSWGTIWQMHCDENEGRFSTGGGVMWARGEWVVSLRSQYRTKSKILKCPAATERLSDGSEYGGPTSTYSMPADGSTVSGGGGEDASYGANNWIYDSDQSSIQGRPTIYNWRTKDVTGAAYVPVFSDTMWRGGGPSESGTGGDPPEYNGQWKGVDWEMMHFCIDRHDKTINMLFMDWHVESVDLKELWTLKWHKQFNTTGPWTVAGGVQALDWPNWMRSMKEY